MTRDLRPECKRIFTDLKDDIKDIKDNHLTDLKDDIKDIKDNHLTHIQTSVAKINTDISWIKKAMFGFLGLGGALLVAYIVSLL